MVYSLHLHQVICCAILAVLLPGCSIYPLPGDIPRVPTSDIVERIRCEVQEGLRSFSSEDPATRKRVEHLIRGTTIGYEFSFVITENNDAAGGQFTFTENRFTGGTFTLDLMPSATLERKNTRAFHLIEELKRVGDANCSPEATQANWAFPITGATGMAEVVRSYIRLQLLSGNTPDLVSLGPKFDNSVFSDSLTYTTNLTAGVTPTLELSAGIGSLRLTHASISGAAGRLDTHDVTVALSFDEKAAGQNAMMRTASVQRQTWANDFFALDSRALRRLAQKDSGVRNRVLIELARRRKIREDNRVVERVLGTPLP
jgi:hypothetical protein